MFQVDSESSDQLRHQPQCGIETIAHVAGRVLTCFDLGKAKLTVAYLDLLSVLIALD